MVVSIARLPPRHLHWPQAWRIIASRYPPIDLFERVSDDPSVWEALIAAEQLVNPRVRDAAGLISLVPPERRVSGPGASYVMAPFTHVNPKGSRFSDGSSGAYYCADRMATAIAETTYHFGRFARDAADPPRREDMRVLCGTVDHAFPDAADLSEEDRRVVLDPDDYSASRALATALRAAGRPGIAYPSVRDRAGRCLAAFRPDVVGIPVQERHLCYEWDGARVSRYFDYSTDTWHELVRCVL